MSSSNNYEITLQESRKLFLCFPCMKKRKSLLKSFAAS